MLNISTRQTAMIGSMPFDDPDSALEALEKHPLSIPTWPQLPARSFNEGMLVQYSAGLPGIRIDSQEKKIFVQRDDAMLEEMSGFFEKVFGGVQGLCPLSGEFSAAFEPFTAILKNSSRKYQAVKGQVVGPYTLGLGVNDHSGKSLWFDEQYRDVIVNAMIKSAVWQVERLKSLAEQVIIFFDEPIMSALGTAAYAGISDEEVLGVLKQLADEVHSAGAAGVGVHCCGNMDWSLLAKSGIDIISFDAFAYGEKVGLYPAEMTAFLERGGYLAWGIVPTTDDATVAAATAPKLNAKVDELLGVYKAKNIPGDLLEQRILFTPACGMGNLSIESTEKVLQLLDALKN